PRRSQASAATILLCLLSECGSCWRHAGKLRLSGVGRLVLVSLFLPGTCFLVKSRPAFAVRPAVLLRPSLITRFVVLTSAAVGLLVFAPGRVQPLFHGRLTLRTICQRLDTDVVFLVGTPDLDGERFRDPFGNLELGGGVQNADGADVMLVDAAATANH